MFPLSFVETFLQKKNIKAIVAILLSIALFFAGILTSPPYEPTNPSDNTTQTTPSENDNTNSNSTKPDSSTTTPDNSTTKSNSSTATPDNSTTKSNSSTATTDNTTNDDEKVEMVWIASSGTKYHSKSSCSNMNSPRQIPLKEAIENGYTACKKCH